jgi:ribonucleoside-diphosphate reductase alpha chain
VSQQISKQAYKTFLDRYSEKDNNKDSLISGAIVIAVIDKSNPLYPKKAICNFIEYSNGMVRLRDYYDPSEEYLIDKTDILIPKEFDYKTMWKRMSRAMKQYDPSTNIQYWSDMLTDFKFLPGGRINAMLGTSYQNNLTALNCFVLPSPKDSRKAILETSTEMIEIMARGGGVGLNISSLRPKNALVRGVTGTSSGAVSWGAMYSFQTGLVEQGGSRRGALLLLLADWHPDIMEFISCKTDHTKITNANLSIGISDAFMTAVKHDLQWKLEFPQTSHEMYDAEWDGDLDKWKAKGYPVIVHKEIKARDLWQTITTSAWSSGEPGLIFLDRMKNMNNLKGIQDIICTNPCGEIPLPAWGVCNLGHINLSKLTITDDDIDWFELSELVSKAVRFLDNIIDITSYINDDIKDTEMQSRRIGLGSLGLGELLIKLGITYGSKESLVFIDKLYGRIKNYAYKASAELAVERGSFPLWDVAKSSFLENPFIRGLDTDVYNFIKENGIRNCQLLTQAPTGSGGSMVETSTGIEPFFSFYYTRNSRLGTETIEENVYANWKKKNPGMELPEYFITAMDLTPEQHVEVQAAIQKHVDASISKTCNLPYESTIEDVAKIYELAYDKGIKGLTVYRTGSRDNVPLELITKEEPKDEFASMKWGETLPPAQESAGYSVALRTGCGKLYMNAKIDLKNKRIFEVFLDKGSQGGCKSYMIATSRMVSKALRGGISVDEVVDQLLSGDACLSYNNRKKDYGDTSKGLSCPHAIGYALLDIQKKLNNGTLYETNGHSIYMNKTEKKPQSEKRIKCPVSNCKGYLRSEGGCTSCPECGYTKCD